MKGVTVTLEKKTQPGTDGFGQPIYTSESISVNDVLVGEPTTEDITNNLAMYGKTIVYTLAIPKGDMNDWEDTYVTLPEPMGGTFHTVGIPTAGIEENIPTRWNKKVHLERFEG